jgi:glycosyltransferase involved in cell wall biosynthesis
MKISVVMPAYNAELYISKAIESILNQTWPDFEFIIIDDGSTDNTSNIINAYAEKDDRIIFLHGPHAGVSAILNTGIEAASGEWIAVMHADDIALPKRLERQAYHAQNDDTVVIWGTNGYRITARDKIIADLNVGPTNVEACQRLRATAQVIQAIHPTVMFRRDIALEVGMYDSRFNGAEDIEFFDRLLRHGHLVTIDEKLMHYRIHGGSLTMKKIAFQKQVAAFLKKRQEDRLNSRPVTTFDAFMAQYNTATTLEKIMRWNQRFVTAQYRTAGIILGDGKHVRGIAHLALCVLINPFYTIGRLLDSVVLVKKPRFR